MAITPLTESYEPDPLVPVAYHATVHDIPVDDRPRERLQKYGAQFLSSADLLAIILRTGTSGENVMELASKLLAKYGGLNGLLQADFHLLCHEHGLGLAKSAQLKAALELGKRLKNEQHDKRIQIHNSDEAAQIVRLELMHLAHEEMHIIVLDSKNHLVEYSQRYKGTVNSSVVRVAEVFRSAIIRNCPRIIICHNHPSGDPTPSPEDFSVTREVIKAGSLLDIELLDHIVIGNPRYISIKEQMGGHW
ncbi:MAG TPA: DNA repair protein RadC [Ktedonobacteraceae bacterium]|jgi:DNA repair protein RadC|nr:DNA repair protein RadC [Ktedonobacteraceae bacterium]